jgi:hypothetical protein
MNTTFIELEKRLNGSRYYSVRPVFENEFSSISYYVHESRREWNKMDDWCANMFGERPFNTWPAAGERWFANDSSFWFRDEADKLLFMLKWS